MAFEVARRLDAPLDVIVVRKLGIPFQPELAMGAIGEDGVRLLNADVIRLARVSTRDLAIVERSERRELDRRVAMFREGHPRIDLVGRIALVVDDGIATGSTAKAACRVARALGAAEVVLAAPVGPRSAQEDVGADADAVVCLEQPPDFTAVGAWYRDFTQTTDAEVVALLDAARHRGPAPECTSPGHCPQVRGRDITIALDVPVVGHLRIPSAPRGVILFAHGSGSSRHSARNRFVASVLEEAGFATLLMDLLTPTEELDRRHVFDIELLGRRLEGTASWLTTRSELAGLPLGLFGASTGSAAALVAAAGLDGRVGAVVSRGGRPDLAAAALPAVTAPTLLVVGGADRAVIELNREAQRQLRCETDLVIVPGATHLFPEPGALERVAVLASDWFCEHLVATSTSRPAAAHR